jgi:hypothetical protein
VRFERIVYGHHARGRMERRRISHAEAKRIINAPDITHPGNKPSRVVARGQLDDGRNGGIVYTEIHEFDADVFVVTVIDFATD